MTKYNVVLDYWNGGERVIVTGEPVELAVAQNIQQTLSINSISEEYFVCIEEVL